jgi:hypothetical protein
MKVYVALKRDRLLSSLSPRGSSISWGSRLRKWRSLVRITPLSLVWTCKKKKKKNTIELTSLLSAAETWMAWTPIDHRLAKAAEEK